MRLLSFSEAGVDTYLCFDYNKEIVERRIGNDLDVCKFSEFKEVGTFAIKYINRISFELLFSYDALLKILRVCDVVNYRK